jgi:excisionase family DNA binding protein
MIPADVATEPTYLTPQQVASLLQISLRSVYRVVEQNADLPVLKIGTAMRFPRARFLEWLKSREQGRAEPKRRLAVVKTEPR